MNATFHFGLRYILILPLLLIGPLFSLSGQKDLSDEALDALLEDEDALEAWLEEEFSGWDFSSTGKFGWGYSDNVLLATVNPQTGGFLRTELELFLLKYPDEKGEFFAFLNGTDQRYFDVEGTDKDQILLIDAEWKRYLTASLTGSLEGQYIFLDQVLDLSLSEREVSRQRIQYAAYGIGGDLILSPLSSSNQFFLKTMVLDEDFGELLGENLLGRIELVWKRPVWKNATLEGELRAELRDYDARTTRDEFGRPSDGTLLKTDRNSAGIDLTQGWGSEKRFSTSLEFRYSENRDNGSGYYDYDQWALDLSFDGEWGGIESNFTIGMDESEFLIQRAERFSPEPRRKSDYVAEFFFKKSIWKRISIYLLANYEESTSNVVEDEYSAFSSSVGFQIDLWGED